MEKRNLEKLEYDKILSLVASYASLDGGKEKVLSLSPSSSAAEVRRELKLTEEASKLLFRYGVGRVEYFSPLSDIPARARKGATLSLSELLSSAGLLRSARIAYKSVESVSDEEITAIRELTSRLYFDERLEDDIFTKIVNETEVSDYASEKLYSIRAEIRALNERIRSRLQECLIGEEAKYLQDSIITMRDNRYVLPVKAEYKRSVKGFIHDKSQSGSTVFIEPEYILEMNNDLKSLQIDEKDEVERILKELSSRVGALAERMVTDEEILTTLDALYARAEYGYSLKCVKPKINEKGVISIVKGRHPLIPQKTVVPVSLSLGEKYSYLLVSGPNTGGKTVTLKMVGLFCLMAASGLFLPAEEGTEVAVFEEVFCDVGDSQSIEENLSTFSSHVSSLVNILNEVNEKSLVLVDELGGGTDPEEGQALAMAILSHLLSTGSKGIITTHFTSLKEFAFKTEGVENACMEFDSETLQPLYRIRLGLPGSSNALAISKKLGMREDVLSAALSFLNDGAKNFELIIRNAEEIRVKAQSELEETLLKKREWQEKLLELEREREKLEKEKNSLSARAKVESRRIINEKTAEAEELLAEMEEIFHQAELSENDLIRARTLKNKISAKAYAGEEETSYSPQYVPFEGTLPKVGEKVFVPSLESEGEVLSLDERKKQAEVLAGGLKLRCKVSDLKKILTEPRVERAEKKKNNKNKSKSENVTVSRNLNREKLPVREINLIGLTVQEALLELENFMADVLLSGFEEVKIVHGFGTGKLKNAVHDYLRKNRHVKEFRIGAYGEGEGGVTIVTLK